MKQASEQTSASCVKKMGRIGEGVSKNEIGAEEGGGGGGSPLKLVCKPHEWIAFYNVIKPFQTVHFDLCYVSMYTLEAILSFRAFPAVKTGVQFKRTWTLYCIPRIRTHQAFSTFSNPIKLTSSCLSVDE